MENFGLNLQNSFQPVLFVNGWENRKLNQKKQTYQTRCCINGIFFTSAEA